MMGKRSDFFFLKQGLGILVLKCPAPHEKYRPPYFSDPYLSDVPRCTRVCLEQLMGPSLWMGAGGVEQRKS